LDADPTLDLTLLYEEQDLKTAEVVGKVCRATTELLGERWGIAPPADCRVYLLDSWRRFVFHAAPWSSRIVLALTYPLWAKRAQALWHSAGGWAQRFGRRHTVCVKPPHAYADTDRSPGRTIFIDAPIDEKIRHVTCHELTHAFTEHLRLPGWLNEGVAMVAVDRLVGEPTVLPESIETLRVSDEAAPPDWKASVEEFEREDHDALIGIYVRGYWITRYLDEEHPELLRVLLEQRRSEEELEMKLAAALDATADSLWDDLHAAIVGHYAAHDLA